MSVETVTVTVTVTVACKIDGDTETWTCGDLTASSVGDMADLMWQALRLHSDDTDDLGATDLADDRYGHGEHICYDRFGSVEVRIGDALLCEVADLWCVCGWIESGASQGIDGSALAMWGDAQHGEYQATWSDGAYDCVSEVAAAITDAIREAIRAGAAGAEFDDPDDLGDRATIWRAARMVEIDLLDPVDVMVVRESMPDLPGDASDEAYADYLSDAGTCVASIDGEEVAWYGLCMGVDWLAVRIGDHTALYREPVKGDVRDALQDALDQAVDAVSRRIDSLRSRD